MDNTALFRACVKAMRVRARAAHSPAAGRPPPPDGYAKQAGSLVSLITALRDFLLAQRDQYINSSRLSTCASALSDAERDRIDAHVEAGVRDCKKLLANLRTTMSLEPCESAQRRAHLSAVLVVVDVYLQRVCQLFAEQRAIRAKRNADLRRMWRLSSLVRKRPPPLAVVDGTVEHEGGRASPTNVPTENLPSAHVQGLRHRRKSSTFEHRDEHMGEEDNTGAGGGASGGLRSKPSKPSLLYAGDEDERTDGGVAEMDLTPAEKQQLTAENERLLERLQERADQVAQLETQVVEIGRLQAIFADKVLEQSTTVQHVGETAVHSTENIKAGNEQLRQAMKRQADTRVYVLFFLLVLTLTLLFLDWYNP